MTKVRWRKVRDFPDAVDAILKQLKLGNSTIQVRVLSWLQRLGVRNEALVAESRNRVALRGSSPHPTARINEINEMKKKTTYTIFAYEPGTEVYAISMWHDNNRPTDHLAIYKAKVSSWSFDAEEKDVMYYLESPKDGKWWGDSIKGEYVSDNMDELIAYAKEIWRNETEI